MAPNEPADVDDLYRLPPDEFVAARDELAKQLRSDGDKEAARAVKALRRPTPAAWALNQVRDRAADDLDELFAAAAELGGAQSGGDGGDDLRALMGRYRQAQSTVVRAALEALRAAGRGSDTQRPAIEATVAAAGSDADVGELLRAGRLTKEVVGGSFGLLGIGGNFGTATVSVGRAHDSRRSTAVAEVDDADAGSGDQRALLAAAIAAAEKAVASAEKEVDRHEASESRARDRIERLEAKVHDLRERLREAEAELDELQHDIDEAAAATDDARSARDDAQAALDEARAALDDLTS